ncbi:MULTISPECIES: glutamate 5-kinase [Vitreoscilla]|uniref:Glutamate 5-kinase n=1 Tax=Vitreoscilla stercoraria TaxID=61 RepID=A0ABY4EBJ7_VITST|nr:MULTISPECIES: glutamate 5-kinase [Vitreoscilla]AUZ06438.1 glutamate 5-kinase [Vitreoscilla sp. C1]UOO92280.1 glutamate 5-kinase [Vitreoscilla stercoraria]
MKSISEAHTLVIKVGSSLVTAEGKGVDLEALAKWAAQIAQLKAQGKQVVFVSSGAIAEGIKRLGWKSRPKALNELQAAAAIGQMGLAQAYEEVFAEHGIQTAQILLTHDDLSNRTRYLNARSTLRTLLDWNVVPIINENDTVTTSEIKLGDNDTLGALVTNLIEADALLILTDQSGLYDSDPRKNPNAKFIHEIEANHPDLESMAGGAGSAVGTGGMYTKVIAAKRAALSGAATLIASGHEPDLLLRLCQGERIGTWLTPNRSRLSARQQWIMGHLQFSGKVTIDAGAAIALSQKHSSLLPIGCIGVQGQFLRGAVISVVNPDGEEVARGLTNYSSDEIEKILRQPSHQIEAILDYVAEEEVLHRDNLVIRSAFKTAS